MSDKITTSPVNIEKDTGKITWDVKYEANFGLIYKIFKKLHDEYKNFLKNDEVKDDDKLKDVSSKLNNLYNTFRTHLRKTYPDQYQKLITVDENELKELLFKKINEESSTGTGASFNAGEGEQYATPNAFNPNKNANGTSSKYYYKLGYKLVDSKNLHKKAKGIEHKDLWTETKTNDENYINSLNLTDPDLKQFITDRMLGFNKVEEKLNEVIPLLKEAKLKTMDFYKKNPSFQVLYGTDLASDYIDDIIKMFKD